MVIKPAAWLRSNQALQSAKNNVRRVPGSDGDSFLRLRWRPGTVSQRCSLTRFAALLRRTRRSGAANAAGSAARARSAKDSRSQPRRRLQSARGRCPPPGGRERQPSRDREFARSSARASALTGATGPLVLQQVAAEGDWGSGLNPGGPASLPEGLKECEGGAARLARDARPAAAGQHPSALRVQALGRLGSAPWPVTGLERTRG